MNGSGSGSCFISLLVEAEAEAASFHWKWKRKRWTKKKSLLEAEAEAIEKKISIFKWKRKRFKNFYLKWKRKRKLWKFFLQNWSGSGSAIKIYRFQNTGQRYRHRPLVERTSLPYRGRFVVPDCQHGNQDQYGGFALRSSCQRYCCYNTQLNVYPFHLCRGLSY